jgi:mono/diheme cytochrome c family protein
MKILLILLITGVTIISVGFKINQTPWPVPADAAKKPNPVKSSSESISSGKALWSQHCSACHGKMGKGDGSKAPQLKTQPNDLSAAPFQSQSDGAIFYQVSEGRGDMPGFKKKLPDPTEIWDLVNYMRTFKK